MPWNNNQIKAQEDIESRPVVTDHETGKTFRVRSVVEVIENDEGKPVIDDQGITRVVDKFTGKEIKFTGKEIEEIPGLEEE